MNTRPHPIRAPSAGVVTLLALVAIACWAGTAHGQPTVGTASEAQAYRLIRLFDFDERPLGNFEDVPIAWRRMDGEGLPFYSDGRFDFDFGHDAPPSYRLDLRGGSIGYEYFRNDLAVSPQSDYLIEAYIRTEGLENARAFLAIYLVDRLGEPIPGSAMISPAVNASLDVSPTWHHVQIDLSIDFPQAHALRLQMWVLQDYVWSEPPAGVVDPIVRQDVDATVWFDDIAVYRMPRVRLALTNPATIVQPGRSESFRVDVHNATLRSLLAMLTVTDDADEVRFATHKDVPPTESRQLDIPVPPLPPGRYHARVELGTKDETLIERSIHFSVLAPLFDSDIRYEDFGVDVGPWRGGSVDGAAELIRALGCGSNRIGVAMIGTPENAQEARHLDEIRELARQLVLSRIETTGVILPPSLLERGGDPGSTFSMLGTEGDWHAQFGPVFAFLGDLLFSWQLGQEAVELRQPRMWNAQTVLEVGKRLERFIAVPQMVIPRSVWDTEPTQLLTGFFERDAAPTYDGQASAGNDAGVNAVELIRERPYAYSFWFPASLPAQAFPWHLSFWFEPETDQAFEGGPAHSTLGARGPEHWIALEPDRSPTLTDAARITDLARRVALAKSVNPDRLYVSAPFQLTTAGGGWTWEPTAEYIPLRTLFHFLSGRQAIAALQLDHDAIGLLFMGPHGSALVLWTWQREVDAPVVELYVGASAYAVDLNGERHRLDRDGVKARVVLTPEPLILEDVDAPLLLLQDSFNVEPRFIQLHDPDPPPVLALKNHYAARLLGTLDLTAPAGWDVVPPQIRVELTAGQPLSEVLHFLIPPRQVASERVLRVDLNVREPYPVELHFDVPLRVGLRDITVEATAWWQDDTLVVEQTLHNRSSRTVSFTSFCQVPRRAQQESVFLEVPPGDIRATTYQFPQARDLAGESVWTGIEEIDGERALDQLVTIPS